MEVNCVICRKPFRTYPSKIKIGRGKYCSRTCCLKITSVKPNQATQFKKGHIPANFKGYRMAKARDTSKEYALIYMPDHPHSTKSGHVREHRLVMEEHLGRYLTTSEIVHHIDGNTLNNSIENLMVMPKKEHDRLNTPLNIHKRWQGR